MRYGAVVGNSRPVLARVYAVNGATKGCREKMQTFVKVIMQQKIKNILTLGDSIRSR